MRHQFFILLFAVGVSATPSSQTGNDRSGRDASPSERATAGARLIDGMNRAVGEARLQQASGGVLLQLNLTNVTPGVHGLHVHERGACDAPSFTSAGGHFAPDKKDHGFLNPNGPHAGDLPNIYVPSSLMLSVEFLIPEVTLGPGAGSLLDGDGSALIIHSWRDNYRSEPAGTAGERLACGRIVGPTVR